jgi:N-acetylmuramoyl-L-alanine amidase
MRPLIVLDPGHGGKFTGAGPYGDDRTLEKHLNWKYAHRIGEELRGMGALIAFTRETDKHLHNNLRKDLTARAELANSLEADLFVSVHCNAFSDPTVHGFEIFTSPGQTKADRFADAIYQAMQQRFPSLNMRHDNKDGDKDKESPLAVLMQTKMPAVLLEMEFMSNPAGLSRLLGYPYLKDSTETIARAIMQEFSE